MNQWDVFIVLGEVLALFFLVAKPVLKLNGTLTELRKDVVYLREKTEEQGKSLEAQKEKASKSHRDLWAHETKQDERLENHEARIKQLEKPE